MEVRMMGAHQLETSTSRLSGLLVDGVVALDAGSLSAGLTLEQQRQLKAIFITHHHFDHCKDLPLIGLAVGFDTSIDVCGTADTLQFISDHLFDGDIYPAFFQWPSADRPALRRHAIEPLQQLTVSGYQLKAIPVAHGAVTAVGYEVSGPGGGRLFYTGDTGPGLGPAWEHTSPQLLIIEVSLPDSLESRALQAGHLTPSLLERELDEFRSRKGYLPRVIATHLHPALEADICAGLDGVSRRLRATIVPGRQGLAVPV